MALFGRFRVRDPQRDRKNDLGRRDRLLEVVRQIGAEIAAERAGLEARYVQAQDRAAFVLEAFENGGGEALSSEADELALAMRRYRARIAALEGQIVFLRKAEAEAAAFYADAPGADPQPQRDDRDAGG